MTATWPSELPRPQRDTWHAQYQDPRQKRQNETGPPGYRRRWSSVAKLVSLSIDVSRVQKSVFDTFHQETTGFGSLPFWMPDPTTDAWPMLTADGRPVLDGAGRPVLLAAQWLCLFGDTMPTEAVSGIRFTISFSVAVMP